MISSTCRVTVCLTICLLVKRLAAACPDECESCEEFGHCSSCKLGHWGLKARCQNNCNEKCLNKECFEENGHCVACEPGFYGFDCRQDCNLCKEGACDLRSCTIGCKAGYYKHFKTNREIICWACPECKYCSDANICTECNDGFQLYKFGLNGKSFVYCVSCSKGDVCSTSCLIQNCDQCQIQNGSLVCLVCKEGHTFNGYICVPQKGNCSQDCSTDCNPDGLCIGDCNAGWTGDRCSEICSSKCRVCDKLNAHICQECVGDFYTSSCNVDCNPSCTKVIGTKTCRLKDGYCNNSCNNNFWGTFCNQSCPVGCVDDGVAQVCDRLTRTCKNGCYDGYDGDTCEKTGTDYISNDENGKYISVYVTGFGTAVYFAVTASVLYCISRRYVDSKRTERGCSNTIKMTTRMTKRMTSNNLTPIPETADNDAHNYETIDNSIADHVYLEIAARDGLDRGCFDDNVLNTKF